MSDETTEQLNLIPQWLKKGPSASPRHAQAPAPPPQPPSQSRSEGPRGGGGDRSGGGERGERTAGGNRDDRPPRGDGGGGRGGGRFQSFVQTEQRHRGGGGERGSQQQQQQGSSASTSSSAQGTFEGGRFTMGDTDRGTETNRSRTGRQGGNPPPPSVSTGDGSSSYVRHSGRSGASDHSSREGGAPPPLLSFSSSSSSSQYRRTEGGAAKIQYTRDELLDLATTSSLDASLFASDLQDGIISSEWLEPELRKQFDTEEIYNAWYDSLQSERRPGGAGGRGGDRGTAQGGGGEGPPRVGGDWRNPPTWRGPKSSAFADEPVKRGGILPPSGGMGLDKMALAAEQFAKEMAATIARGGLPLGSEGTPDQLKGLLGESTGNSILDEPLEEGLDRPPEEEVIPKEEAIDFEEDNAVGASNNNAGVDEAENDLAAKLALAAATALEQPSVGHQPHHPATMLPKVPLGGLEGLAGPSGPSQPPAQLPAFVGMRGSTLPLGTPALGVNDPWGAGLGGLDLLSAGSVFPSSSSGKPIGQPQQQQARTSSLLPPARIGGVQQGPSAAGQMFAPVVAPPPPPPQMDDWFYMDPQGAIQGPFSSKEMKEWFEAGYFKPDLPVSYGQHGGAGKFYPLAAVYSDLRTAFLTPPNVPAAPRGWQQPGQGQGGLPQLPNLGPTILQQPQGSQGQQQQQFAVQQQQQQLAAKQRMMMLEEQQRAMAEENQRLLLQQQQQQEQQERLRIQQLQEQQERMRREEEIRLQQQRALEEQARAQAQAHAQQKQQQQQQPAWNTATQSSPAAPSLAQIRAEEERQKKEQEKSAGVKPVAASPKPTAAAPAKDQASAAPSTPQQPAQKPSQQPQQQSAGATATPWGKSAQEAVRAPTLKEIQEAEEEERKRAQRAQGDAPPMTMASHVAKAAGIETRTWSGTAGGNAAASLGEVPAKKAIPSAVLAPPSAQPTKAQPKAAATAATSAAAKPAAPVSSQSSSSPPASQQSAGEKKKSEAVYGNQTMSSEFRAWCEENAPSIGADMALLEFCYGVDNTEEVKETFSGYLGYKPNVLSFVDEFLRRVNLDKNLPEGRGRGAPAADSEWKGATGGKGGSKKKNRG